ncbi:hypothetical protein, partial [Lactobacillus acetotolerans]|uniref:hypothetical protein n=1 Tax=Lactobacillus acetotolerans TaxID=1600 RepID=UPI001E419F72
FYAIKNLLTAYHIDKSSTGKIIEPKGYRFFYAIFNNKQKRSTKTMIRNMSFITFIEADWASLS